MSNFETIVIGHCYDVAFVEIRPVVLFKKNFKVSVKINDYSENMTDGAA